MGIGINIAGTGIGLTQTIMNQKNKQTGAFILIDPITNNTSAVGMIIDRVDARDMVTEDALAVLNLPELGIGPEHYEAIRSVCKELERQGVSVKCITENK